MENLELYSPLIERLTSRFGRRLKTVVLFGSRARGKTDATRDHDIFMVIEDLPAGLIQRQNEIRAAIWDIPIRVNTISKTPEEVDMNLTPLLLEICVDGICLYGRNYFEPYRRKANKLLKDAGLKRKRVGKEWYWQFEKMPQSEWDLSWEGFSEL